MLFVIDPSIVIALEEPNPSLDVINAIDLVASSCRNGIHLIYAKRDVLDRIRNFQGVSEVTRQVFTHLFNRFPQSNVYLDTFTSRIEIIAGKEVLDSTYIDKTKIIRVSADFISLSIMSSTIILSENLNDALFYSHVGEIYKARYKLKGVYISRELRGGGGNTVSQEYGQLQINMEHLCICFVDSDREYSGSDLGNTAKGVSQVDNMDQPLCETHILNSRELENIIPLRIYQEAFEGDPNRTDAVIELERIEHDDMRMYLDIKKGLRLREILSRMDHVNFYNYWIQALGRVACPDSCWSEYECTQKENCSCILLRGIGNQPVVIVNEFLDLRSPQKLSEFVDSSVEEDWDRLGAIIVSWCCANKPIRTLGRQ